MRDARKQAESAFEASPFKSEAGRQLLLKHRKALNKPRDFLDINMSRSKPFVINHDGMVSIVIEESAVKHEAEAQKICGAPSCGKDNASKRCGNCRVTNYCSEKCQRSDWPQHKLSCKKIDGK